MPQQFGVALRGPLVEALDGTDVARPLDLSAEDVAKRPDVLVVELAALSPDNERFDAKTTVLIENVRHHIEEEEDEWFPKVREGLGRKQLQEIGEEMLEAKKTAPREPSQPSALKKTIDAIIS